MSDNMSEDESGEGKDEEHGDGNESSENYEAGEAGQNVGNRVDFSNDQVVITFDEISIPDFSAKC